MRRKLLDAYLGSSLISYSHLISALGRSRISPNKREDRLHGLLIILITQYIPRRPYMCSYTVGVRHREAQLHSDPTALEVEP